MAPPVRRPERLPPFNEDAEQSVLGSILLDASAISKVATILRPQDFWLEKNGLIYATMLDLYEQGSPLDYVTITTALGERLENAGGFLYLSSLIGVVPSPLHIERYADLVSHCAVQRRLVSAGAKIMQLGYDTDVAADQAVERAEAILTQVGPTGGPETFTPLNEGLKSYWKELVAIRDGSAGNFVVPSGFLDLDTILQGGFGKSDLIILAARPAMGKTALSLQLAKNAGFLYGANVVFFSLEMSMSQLVGRMLACDSGVALERLRNPKAELQEFEMGRLGDAFGRLAKTNLLIDDSPEMNISLLRSRVRKLQQRRDIDMIVVDHIQLLAGSQSSNRNQEMEEVSRQLKALARELNIPVIVLSQLSRECEKRSDKRPILSDLRDSGGIEQNADVVIFLYRDDYYNNDSDRQGAADLIVAKHRNGPTGQATLLFTQRLTRFIDVQAYLEGGR